MRVTGIPAPPEFLLSQTGPVDDGFEPDNENGRIAWRCLARRMVFWQAPPVPQESPPQSGPPPPSEPPPVVPVACRGHVSPSVPHLVHSAPTEAPDVQGDRKRSMKDIGLYAGLGNGPVAIPTTSPTVDVWKVLPPPDTPPPTSKPGFSRDAETEAFAWLARSGGGHSSAPALGQAINAVVLSPSQDVMLESGGLIRCTGFCGRSWVRWEDVPHWSKSRRRKPWCSDCGSDAPGPWNDWAPTATGSEGRYISNGGHQCSGAVAVSGRYVGVWRSHPLHWVLWQVVGALGGCASLFKEP